MTNEEAIEIMLMQEYSKHCGVTDCPFDGCKQCYDAFDMAIEALEAQIPKPFEPNFSDLD